MFLRRFNPTTIDPLYLVNRATDLDWLGGAVSDYLRDADPRAHGPLPFCILGEKGVGKTIFTRAALRQAREQFSDRAIFVEVDCRDFRTAKAAIDAIAKNVVEALDDLRGTGTPVSSELMSTAQMLAAITRFDDAELKDVHQHLVQFRAATSLKGEQALLRVLKLDFQISIERSISTTSELSGKVRFDEMRLCRALAALFEDIRRSDIDIVLYIDNMDELSHHFQTAEERQKARRDTEVLLALREARIIFIVAMRTYYSGILPREIANTHILGRLPIGELLAILEKRLDLERPEVKQAVGDLKAIVVKVANRAPTPLAFLTWFKALFEAGALSEEKLEAGVTEFLERSYATIPAGVWQRVVAAFAHPDDVISREALLNACDGNEARFNQIVDRQGVLPKDFWSPTTYYTLDPELHIVHPLAAAPGVKI